MAYSPGPAGSSSNDGAWVFTSTLSVFTAINKDNGGRTYPAFSSSKALGVDSTFQTCINAATTAACTVVGGVKVASIEWKDKIRLTGSSWAFPASTAERSDYIRLMGQGSSAPSGGTTVNTIFTLVPGVAHQAIPVYTGYTASGARLYMGWFIKPVPGIVDAPSW
eukprot:gene3155-4506_t